MVTITLSLREVTLLHELIEVGSPEVLRRHREVDTFGKDDHVETTLVTLDVLMDKAEQTAVKSLEVHQAQDELARRVVKD